jgi:enoyl-CoA hydratase
MDYEHLLLRQDGDALWVTMNRPEKLNALNRKFEAELRTLFLDLYTRREARVVVLTGAGRSFCAGVDLQETQQILDIHGSTGQAMDRQRDLSEIVIAMRRCPQPIIGLINGAASGAGFGIALACDVRIASPQARMNAAFIRVGVSACDVGVSYFLPRMVGASVASELMLTGRFIDAERARSLGLVSTVVAPEELEAAGAALAAEMLRATPLGLRLTKDGLNHAIDAGSLEAVIAMEDRNQVMTVRDENFQEGVNAFLEKRPPKYKS